MGVSKRNFILAFTIVMGSFSAFAEEKTPIGKVLHFKGECFINGKPAQAGDTVYLNDVVKVGNEKGMLKIDYNHGNPENQLVVTGKMELKLDENVVRTQEDFTQPARGVLNKIYRLAEPKETENIDYIYTGTIGSRG